MFRSRLSVAAAFVLAGLIAAVSVAVAQTVTHTAEVRIVAQRLDDGRVEFGLQQREGSGWSERILPQRRFFPTSSVGRWLSSSTITLEVPAGAAPGVTPTATTTPAPTATATPAPTATATPAPTATATPAPTATTTPAPTATATPAPTATTTPAPTATATPAPTATTTPAPTATARPTQGATLAVAPESCSGYDRAAFGSYPDVRSGSSFYLGRSITASNRSQFHTDHVVALREACESGLARSRWREFGSYAANLVPALGSLNSSKGASDPAEWANPHRYGQITPERWCAYIQRHVAVKQHFGLTADQAELAAINASGCAAVTPGSTPTPTPTATPPRDQTYASCSAVPSSVARIQGCSRGRCPAGGWGYPSELVPSARDGDSDGVVCER